MELHWTTVLLEIINFLVLVWLLHRFLFRPVLAVIDRRREAIEKTLADAHAVRTEAEDLERHYRERLDEWEAEKATARLHFQEALDAERERRLQTLRQELQAERERARVVDERHERERVRTTEERALELAVGFAAAMLGRLASPALEGALVDAVLEDLEQMPDDRRQLLRTALRGESGSVRIESAFALEAAQQERIRLALEALAEQPVACAFTSVPELQAGLRISLEHWVLGANLADELRHFHELGAGVGYEVRRERDRSREPARTDRTVRAS